MYWQQPHPKLQTSNTALSCNSPKLNTKICQHKSIQRPTLALQSTELVPISSQNKININNHYKKSNNLVVGIHTFASTPVASARPLISSRKSLLVNGRVIAISKSKANSRLKKKQTETHKVVNFKKLNTFMFR